VYLESEEDEEGGEEGDDSEEDKEESDDSEPRSVSTRIEVRDDRKNGTPSQWIHQQAASVAAFDLDERSRRSETLSDLLEEVAGIHIRRLGGPSDPAWVTIRGSSARQVEIFVDGIPLNAHGTQAINLSELDLAAFERVEVFRGFSPPELGSSAMGGVVHLKSRPGVRSPPHLELGYGSWSTRRFSTRFGEAWTLPSGLSTDLRANLTYAGTEGNFTYLDDRGTLTNLGDDRTAERANNASDQLDASLLGRLATGPLSLSLGSFLLWSQAEVPGTRYQRARRANLSILQNLLVLRSSLAATEHLRLHGDLGWRIREEDYKDPLSEIGLGRPSLRHLFQDVQGSGTLAIEPLPWLRVIPSFRLGYDHYSSQAESTTEDPADRSRLSFSASFGTRMEPFSGKLSLQPSIGLILLDNRNLGVSEIAEDEAGSASDPLLVVPVPRFAIAVRPVEWITIRAAIQEGARAPSFTELFGDRGALVGNTYLRPEQSKSIDAGIRLRGSLPGTIAGSFEFGGFRVIAEDAIVFLTNAQNTVVPTNFGATRIEGLELAGRVRLFDHLEFTGALTWSDSEITEGLEAHLGNRIPHVPVIELDARVAFRWDPWIQLSYQLRHSGETYESASNLFELPPRNNHSLSLRLMPKTGLPWLQIDLHNLTDERLFVRARDPSNPQPDDRVVVSAEDFRGNPLAGRSFFLTVGWSPATSTHQSARVPPGQTSKKERTP